jgi:ribonuclease T2
VTRPRASAPGRSAVIMLATLLAAVPALGFEALEGCFLAERACPTGVTLREAGEPGGVALEPGKGYRLLGANRPGRAATHLQVRVPGAEPGDRWVEAGCGRRLARCGDEAAPGTAAPAEAPVHVLAVSWQPAFCERNRRRPECRDEAAPRAGGRGLALHGLWPEAGEYCGVAESLRRRDRPGRWERLPAVPLSAATRAALEAVMPGTRSGLERHEWLRHGTCFGASAEAYFGAAVRLVQELAASPVAELLASRVGEELTLAEIHGAFDRAFGQGAGRRVGVVCEGARAGSA